MKIPVAEVYDETICELGEGPLWHPLRRALFWFDITGNRLYERYGSSLKHWQFDEFVSAAGWVDASTLLIASETALSKFDLDGSTRETVTPLEANNTATRSNDGRGDKWGGFWIGTMGKKAERGAGAIYRYYKGELRRLHANVSISNSICFSLDGCFAFFSDTALAIIWRQALDPADGWPCADREVFLDLSTEGLHPDGAVIDSEGFLWNAQWGAGRLARYALNGQLDRTIDIPAGQVTCPAFGQDNLKTLYVTSATEGLSAQSRNQQPHSGKTFTIQVEVAGVKEHQVIL